MKIIKYQKQKNNKYDIYLANSTKVSLYDEVILNNDLLLTKEIKDINNLLKENEYYEAYYDALKYINRKLRSTKEIEKYLSKKYDSDNLLKVIDRLKSEKYINDELYAISYIHDAFLLTNKGYNKIYHELDDLSIPDNIIKSNLDNISYEEWFNKLKKLINKKINSNNNYSNKNLVNKIYNYFINLGYSYEMINDIINDINLNNDKDILNKKYHKLYNRLSKKYQDKELDNQIINHLLKDGFNYDDIKNLLK